MQVNVTLKSLILIPLCIFAVVISVPPTVFGQEVASPASLRARVTVINPIAHVGQVFELEYEIQNISDKPITVLNPLLFSSMSFAGSRLLLYDGNGKCIGDLFKFRGRGGNGSHGPLVSESYWVTLPPGAIVGVKDEVRAYRFLGGSELSAGIYRLELVLLDTFVSDYPFADLPSVKTTAKWRNDARYNERWMKWVKEHPGKELFRSNQVEIVMLDEKK